MNTSFTHYDIQELLGAFALDAVDEEERDVIEAHLAGCPRCRAEVEGYRETAALLAQGGDRAPEGVWDRIAEALDEAPPAMDLARIAPPARPGIPGPAGPPDDVVGPRDDLAGRREARADRRSISLRAAAATMAVAAALTLFLGVALGHRDDGGLGRVDRIAAAMQKAGVSNAAYAALADPRAEQVKLVSSDGKATAQVVRLPDGTGYLVPSSLAALPAGRVYQLWAVRSDAKISLGVLGQTPEVSAFRMAGPVLAYAVTEEAAGGVAASQNQPVIVGFVNGQAPGKA
ncbi:MAG TPA: anti-sigma factor [Acidimicrobiia bacterium]|nr:anti-sigma factor [Acidimicrobiia bacterium]